MSALRWLNAFTRRAPATRSATTWLETRPCKSTGLNSGASIGLLASMTIRPPQAGRPARAAGSFDQLTAIKTMSAVAACSRVPALMVGLRAATDSFNDSGPRLFAMVAAMPARDSVFATAKPILPAPMMPMLMVMLPVVRCLRLRRGGKRAELLHEREEIGHAPVLGDLAVAHAHHVHGLELDFATSWREAEEFALVRAMVGFVRRHPVPIGELPVDVRVEVRKGSAQNLVEFARAGFVGRASRLRGMVEKIVGEQFIEHFEIPAALHFLGVASNDCFRGFAHIDLGHDVL